LFKGNKTMPKFKTNRTGETLSFYCDHRGGIINYFTAGSVMRFPRDPNGEPLRADNPDDLERVVEKWIDWQIGLHHTDCLQFIWKCLSEIFLPLSGLSGEPIRGDEGPDVFFQFVSDWIAQTGGVDANARAARLMDFSKEVGEIMAIESINEKNRLLQAKFIDIKKWDDWLVVHVEEC
jgi:hypothetical protein